MARLLPCGDGAVLVSFAGEAEPGRWVAALDRAVADERLRGVAEVVPGIESLLVLLDGAVPLARVRAGLEAAVEVLAAAGPPPAHPPGRTVDLPVRFGGDDGPDLRSLAEQAGMTEAGVVAALTSAPLTVALVGHLPGLPYLTGLPPAFDIPRRATPRTSVPEGSVGVAAAMVCVYPQRAPGGWHIVGRTDARLTDARRDPPFLLAPGDAARLLSIR